jgi:hypothetical protein
VIIGITQNQGTHDGNLFNFVRKGDKLSGKLVKKGTKKGYQQNVYPYAVFDTPDGRKFTYLPAQLRDELKDAEIGTNWEITYQGKSGTRYGGTKKNFDIVRKS